MRKQVMRSVVPGLLLCLGGFAGISYAAGIDAKYPVKLYGYIKLDAAYDDSRMNEGNFAKWVESESTNEDDDQFNMTARQSRFGLDFEGPDMGGCEVTGKVEVDFYEGGSENKNRLMMRHAYVDLNWHDSDLSLLAGQTTDVVFPLLPPTLNYGVGWWTGNPGYRRPQLRLTKGIEAGDVRLVLQGAAARTIGSSGTGFDPGDTGEDAGVPSVQGRVALSLPFLAEKKATIGISGHWGEEEYDTDNTGTATDYDTNSVCLDVSLPLAEKLAINGEVWKGENLESYLGGIGQGINTTLKKEIESEGGWVAASIGPFEKLSFNVGGGIDDPDDDDLNNSARSKNTSIFGNVFYNVNEAVQLGLEVSKWETDYKNLKDGDNIRVQTSVIYKF